LEERGASLDVRDYCGRRVIDWINDCASDPKNRDDTVWMVDVERLTEIANCLHERGADSSAVCVAE
jgi:hypothetical protein